jgi:Resolvase, N terminal domain
VTTTTTITPDAGISAIAEQRRAAGLCARHGYGRVSTLDQNTEAQHDRLIAAGCAEENIRIDHGVSGSRASRPEWDKLLDALQPGDELVCTKLDRIGRSMSNLLDIVRLLAERGVELVVLDQNIDTRTPVGKLLFHILAAIAEFERDLIIERTRDGQAAVRATGNMRRIMAGPPPFGWRDPGPADDDRRDWVLDVPAAQWLAEVAQRVIDDPEHRVATAHKAQVKAAGEITDSLGRVLTVKMLRDALVRPASAGLIEAGGVEWGRHPAGGPLDEEAHSRLVVIFGARKVGRPPKADYYTFGSVLACGKCGNILNGRPGRPGVRYYACNNSHLIDGVRHEPCGGTSVHAADVNAVLRAAVEEWALSPEGRAVLAELPAANSRRAELAEEIARQQEAAADLFEKNQDGLLPRDRYRSLSERVRRAIRSAEAELEQLDAEERDGPGVTAIDWEAMDGAAKVRAVKRALITPIRVLDGGRGGGALPTPERLVLIPRT